MNKKVHTVDSVFMLLVFTIFAVASLLLVLIGAGVYRGVVRDSDANNQMRATLSYVANQVRTYDNQDGVRLEEIDGLQVLVMPSESDGMHYVTYLYYHEGQIKELYLTEKRPFDPTKGQTVAQVENFTMEQQESTLIFSATDVDQQTMSLRLTLRCA